jgi:DNA-directed RNA polymerase subunit RPC12/RpoP
MVNEVFPDHLVVGVMNSVDIDIAKGRDVPLKAEVDVYSGNRDLLCCNCGDKIDIEDKPNYCSGCGQRIDWEGIENEI